MASGSAGGGGGNTGQTTSTQRFVKRDTGNKDLKNQKTSSILKGIRSNEKRIQEHLDKIANPQKYSEDWDKMTPERIQKRIIHWQQEISVFEKNILDAQNELRRRGLL